MQGLRHVEAPLGDLLAALDQSAAAYSTNYSSAAQANTSSRSTPSTPGNGRWWPAVVNGC